MRVMRIVVWATVLVASAAFATPASAQLDDCGVPLMLGAAPDPRYHDEAEIAIELARLEAAYPTIAKRYDLTAWLRMPLTHEGRRIYALKISDNVARDEDEPSVLIVSNHHARELITPEIAIDLANRLCSGYGQSAQITSRVDANEIWICPTFNPDGLAYVWSSDPLWRKNRRNNGRGVYGVDLNRNYPVHFALCGASTDPTTQTYQGPSAASEPETQTMMAFATRQRFAKVLDFHSYARDVRKPYGCNLCLPQAPCNYYIAVQGTLASLAGYATNASCCGGGHFAYQTHTSGALAFLVETGTSFQPSYANALAEVIRLRPMIDAFIDQPIQLAGRVTNALTGEPVVANVSVAGVNYQYGEIRRSEGRFGRYHEHLPAGNYSVTFTAIGYKPVTRPVTIPPTGGAVVDIGMMPSAELTQRGAARVGQSFAIDLQSVGDENQAYLIAASFSTTPAQTILGRTWPLAADPLYLASLSLPSVFMNTLGQLDTVGAASATIVVPNVSGLAGTVVFFAALTADPSPRVRSVSAPHRVQFVP